MEHNKQETGSLTVEAIISFTAFLMASFLMLHLVKLTMLSLVLQSAVSETAKQMATAAYPMVVVNSLQETGEDQVQSWIDETGATLESLLSGGEIGGMAGQLLGEGAGGSVDLLSAVQEFMGQGQDALLQAVGQLKGMVGIQLAAHLMDGYLEASGLPFDQTRVRFRVVKLPQTKGEFEAMSSYTIPGKRTQLVLQGASASDATDGDYNQDDVVICAEYDYVLALPMLPKIELTLRSVAVEHAWLAGCQVRTVRKEGLGEDWIFENKVFIATGGYGKCFHREDCRMIDLRKIGYTPAGMNRETAVEQGFQPCKTCNP